MALLDRTCTRLLAMLIFLVSAEFAIAQSQPVLWTNAGTGNWNTGTNWEFGLVPLGDGVLFFDVGIINNGGTAEITSASPNVGGINLGQGASDSGTLIVKSGGSITSNAVGSTGGNIAAGADSGLGTLIVESGGSTVSDLMQVTGADGSSLTLENGGSIVVNGRVDLLRNARIIGPSSSFTVGANLQIDRNFTAEITDATDHTAIDLSGSNGNVLLGADSVLTADFSNLPGSPSIGDTWTVIRGNSLGGFTNNFSSVQVAGVVPPSGVVGSSQIDVATNELEFRYGGILTLSVDRRTGAASISTGNAESIGLESYAITSDAGHLSPSGWTSFEEAGAVGGGWIDGESGPGGGNNFGLAEGRGAGPASFSAGMSQSIGNIVDNAGIVLGEVREDFEFTYLNGDKLTQGVVEYTGLFNNLVLRVDPSTGEAELRNESTFDIELESYAISSASDALLPDPTTTLGTGWDGLQEQGAGWIGCTTCDGSGNEVLAEGTTGSPFSLASGSAIDIGTIWDLSAEDLSLEFLYDDGGNSATLEGVVVYEPIVDQAGDFDGDGDVDGADFLTWQRTDGTPAGLTEWQNNYGAGVGPISGVSAVPEPAAGILGLIALCLGGVLRGRSA